MELFRFMTLSASLLILLALLLRPLTGRVLPRGIQMLLWIAASLRLVIPVRIASPFSFFSLFTERAEETVVIPETLSLSAAAPIDNSTVTAAVPETPAASVPEVSAAPAITFTELLPWIWLTGAVLFAVVLIFLHIRELRRCRTKRRDTETEQLVPRFVRVYRCEAVSAPFVSGLLRPQILLPEALSEEELPAVLAHELAHIRGLDLLKKYLFAAALCANWFNPLVWIMTRLAAQDLEILCDRRALRGPDAPSPKAYAYTLLNAEERRTLFTLGFKSSTEKRIRNILKKEKINRFAALFSAMLILLLTAACATQPVMTTASASLGLPMDTFTVGSQTDSTALSEFLIQGGYYGLGELHLNTKLEDIEALLLEQNIPAETVIGGTEDAMLGLLVPLTLMGYDGTAYLYCPHDKLTDIVCSFAFESTEEASAAYYTMLGQLYNALGPAYSTDGDVQIWKQYSTSLSIYIAPFSHTDITRRSVRVHITGIPLFASSDSSSTLESVEWQMLESVLSQQNVRGEAKQDAVSMYLNIKTLETTIHQQELQLSSLQAQYVDTILQTNTSYTFRTRVQTLMREGASFESAVKTASYEQGLAAVDALREELPDLTGTPHRKLKIHSSTGSLVLAEIDLPNDGFMNYLNEIKTAFSFYDATYSITAVSE